MYLPGVSCCRGDLGRKTKKFVRNPHKVERIVASEGINEGELGFDFADVLGHPVLPESPLYSPASCHLL